MSELDSLSDYEWLEISSTQSSDDDSLISSRDSDRDGTPSMPPSRRSSISIGSSVDGEIDAWEGLVEDHEDSALDSGPLAHVVASADHTSVPDSVGRAFEEQFVTAALEQSLVGTLSASRTSSLGPSTVHNSVRDLRLSFPDPLTSSRDELNRSYETVSSPDIHCITVDGSNSPMTAAVPGDASFVSLSEDQVLLSEDQVAVPVVEISSKLDTTVQRWDDNQINGFDVILYPSTAQSRDFAQWLLSVLATGEASPSKRTEYTFLPGKDSFDFPSAQTSRPSLAIVSLPLIPRMPKHTLYLPVAFPAPDSEVAPEIAIKSWFYFCVHDPSIRTARLSADPVSSVVLDGPEMRKRVDPGYIQKQLQPLLAPRVVSPRKTSIGPVHAVTFVALFSLLVGFAVNTTFRSPSLRPVPTATARIPAQTTPSTFWNMFVTAPNSSLAPVSTTPTSSLGNSAIIPSTLKDFALAVFQPTITTPPVSVASISVAPAPPIACGPGTTGSSSGGCKPMAWSEKIKSSTDVIVRPPTALSNPEPANGPPTHTPSVGGTVVTVSALPVEDSAVTSLSLKLADSLSEIADATMRALEEVVAHDFRELKNALDALMRAIGYQTSMIVEEYKSRGHVLRERLLRRHERAKGKARELRQMGEQLVSVAGKQFRARADVAKTRAQSLKKSLLATSLWRTYAEAHGDWTERLAAKKGKRRDGMRERRKGLFTRLKEKRENRKKRLT